MPAPVPSKPGINTKLRLAFISLGPGQIVDPTSCAEKFDRGPPNRATSPSGESRFHISLDKRIAHSLFHYTQQAFHLCGADLICGWLARLARSQNETDRILSFRDAKARKGLRYAIRFADEPRRRPVLVGSILTEVGLNHGHVRCCFEPCC
jgi:hypothetical protein